MKFSLDQIYGKFCAHLTNHESNMFLLYVIQNDKVKKFVISQFNDFYEKNVKDNDNCWFFRNCCYLYLFVNNNQLFYKIELKKVFDCFFDKDSELDNYYGMDSLEKL